MPSKHNSEKIQLEILNEIAENQGTANTIFRNDPAREWNYNFLLQQGYIEQTHTECVASGPSMLKSDVD